jgi:hypothetical protein
MFAGQHDLRTGFMEYPGGAKSDAVAVCNTGHQPFFAFQQVG